MAPRKRKVEQAISPEKEWEDFYFQNISSSYQDYVPNLSLNNLTGELKLIRFMLKYFFEKVIAEKPDLKALGEAIYRVGAAVVQVSKLIIVRHKLEEDQNPVNELHKAIEEILSNLHANASEEE